MLLLRLDRQAVTALVLQPQMAGVAVLAEIDGVEASRLLSELHDAFALSAETHKGSQTTTMPWTPGIAGLASCS